MSQGPVIKSCVHVHAHARQIWARDDEQESQLEGTGEKLTAGPISFQVGCCWRTTNLWLFPGSSPSPLPPSTEEIPSECLVNAPMRVLVEAAILNSQTWLHIRITWGALKTILITEARFQRYWLHWCGTGEGEGLAHWFFFFLSPWKWFQLQKSLN